MPEAAINQLLGAENIGDDVYALAAELYPICRSITGDGVRATLQEICKHIPLEMHEVQSGVPVLDWTVPKEWNIKDAYIKNERGERIVDFQKCNLHVLGYSVPVHKNLSLSELRPHLITLPEQPDWIPYRTSYYKETWGFCLSHNQMMALEEGTYEVCIDSSLSDGHLSYGECVLVGDSQDEVLFSAHTCHPSLANDNLSGIALLTYLAKHMQDVRRKYTYRFIFAPGTIGSLVWLARNEQFVARIKHGLVVSCVGDGGGPTYKRSRRGNAAIDLAVVHVLSHFSEQSVIEDFSPYGYDERQYCSPGFNLPVGLFERSKYGVFPQYHTSADNLGFIKPEHLAESYQMIVRVINILENDGRYLNTHPKGEPQLGRRGLYNAIGGDKEAARKQMAMLWALNLSDGEHSLLEIANRAGLPFEQVQAVSQLLLESGLLEKSED